MPVPTEMMTIFLFSLLFVYVNSLGTLELQLRHFRNPSGRDLNGACCHNSPLSGSNDTETCGEPCDTYFRICIKQYQRNIDPDPPCTYLSRLTKMRRSNSIDFGAEDFVKWPFSFAWPGSLSIIIEAFHNGSTDPTESRQLLLRVAKPTDLPVGPKWISQKHKTTPAFPDDPSALLSYRYRVTCDEHYFGKECAHYCVPRDNSFGHYKCGPKGEKLCMDGWRGRDCNDAICSPGCHPENGHCDVPGTCECTMGYIGENCTQCQPYPGCKNGYCDKPYTCKCKEGWGGLFCNQDLNYCTHYKPCQNAATCVNTGAGHYKCQCQPGYTGANCQTKVEDCSQDPCQNGGTCRALGTNYTCECPVGFSGRHCQVSAQTCGEDPCENGATCVTLVDRYMCLCAPGWEGDNCDIEIDECKPNPCLHGGQCIDDFNGFKCVCPVGYSGDRCEQNDNDCTAHTCLNGGTCMDEVNSFKCVCPPGFMGTLCQDDIDDCLKRPCAYGGTCFDLVNDYKCMCRPGFKGKDCSIDINECESSPCRNGGSCIDQIDDYHCECPKCFSGKNCRTRDESCLAQQTHIFYPPINSSLYTENDPRNQEKQPAPFNMTFVYLMAIVTTVSLLFVLGVVCVWWRRSVRKRARQEAAQISTVDFTPDLEALRQNAVNHQKLINNCGSDRGFGCPKVDNTHVAELLQRSGKFPVPTPQTMSYDACDVSYDKYDNLKDTSPSPSDSGYSQTSDSCVKIVR